MSNEVGRKVIGTIDVHGRPYKVTQRVYPSGPSDAHYVRVKNKTIVGSVFTVEGGRIVFGILHSGKNKYVLTQSFYDVTPFSEVAQAGVTTENAVQTV